MANNKIPLALAFMAILAVACGGGASPAPSPTPTSTGPAPLPTPRQTPEPTPTPKPQPQARIAFVSERDGNQEIYVMNADGSGVSRLTHNTADDYDPLWSPVP